VASLAERYGESCRCLLFAAPLLGRLLECLKEESLAGSLSHVRGLGQGLPIKYLHDMLGRRHTCFVDALPSNWHCGDVVGIKQGGDVVLLEVNVTNKQASSSAMSRKALYMAPGSMIITRVKVRCHIIGFASCRNGCRNMHRQQLLLAPAPCSNRRESSQRKFILHELLQTETVTSSMERESPRVHPQKVGTSTYSSHPRRLMLTQARETRACARFKAPCYERERCRIPLAGIPLITLKMRKHHLYPASLLGVLYKGDLSQGFYRKPF
jgi:hypothetical protein